MGNTSTHMVPSKVSLLPNFKPRMARLWLARIETPDKTKSPYGGLTVLDLLTTKILVLLGWFRYSWIIAKSLLREAATASPSAGLRSTVSSVGSSAQPTSLFSTSSIISQLCRINRRGPQQTSLWHAWNVWDPLTRSTINVHVTLLYWLHWLTRQKLPAPRLFMAAHHFRWWAAIWEPSMPDHPSAGEQPFESPPCLIITSAGGQPFESPPCLIITSAGGSRLRARLESTAVTSYYNDKSYSF